MLAAPVCEEHAAFEDLAQDGPADPFADGPEVLNRTHNILAQIRSLREVLCRQLMENVFFACEELQEVEVRFGP
eukprot:10833182-Heterocapsa_arctica.AAC.1